MQAFFLTGPDPHKKGKLVLIFAAVMSAEFTIKIALKMLVPHPAFWMEISVAVDVAFADDYGTSAPSDKRCNPTRYAADGASRLR